MSIKVAGDEPLQASCVNHRRRFCGESTDPAGIITAVDHGDHFTDDIIVNDFSPSGKHGIFRCHACFQQFKIPVWKKKKKRNFKETGMESDEGKLREKWGLFLEFI